MVKLRNIILSISLGLRWSCPIDEVYPTSELVTEIRKPYQNYFWKETFKNNMSLSLCQQLVMHWETQFKISAEKMESHNLWKDEVC